jgi:hypothetical protein
MPRSAETGVQVPISGNSRGATSPRYPGQSVANEWRNHELPGPGIFRAQSDIPTQLFGVGGRNSDEAPRSANAIFDSGLDGRSAGVFGNLDSTRTVHIHPKSTPLDTVNHVDLNNSAGRFARRTRETRRPRQEIELDIIVPSRRHRRSRSNTGGEFFKTEDSRVLRLEQQTALDAQPDYEDEIDDGEPVFYDFGRSTSNANRDSDLGGLAVSDDESIMTAEEDLEQTTSGGAKGVGTTANHVLESRYSGDGGHHSVSLTTVLSARAQVPQSQFRWM